VRRLGAESDAERESVLLISSRVELLSFLKSFPPPSIPIAFLSWIK